MTEAVVEAKPSAMGEAKRSILAAISEYAEGLSVEKKSELSDRAKATLEVIKKYEFGCQKSHVSELASAILGEKLALSVMFPVGTILMLNEGSYRGSTGIVTQIEERTPATENVCYVKHQVERNPDAVYMRSCRSATTEERAAFTTSMGEWTSKQIADLLRVLPF